MAQTIVDNHQALFYHKLNYLLPSERDTRLYYCVFDHQTSARDHLLSRVIRFFRSTGASGLFTRQSQNLMWTISYCPRNSWGKGLKQSWTTRRTLRMLYRDENCSSDISKPSTVVFGKCIAVSRAQALYYYYFWQKTGRDSVPYAVPVPTSAIRKFLPLVGIVGLIK